VWHASLVQWGRTHVIHPDRWGDGTRRAARRILGATLDGVGQGETVEQVIRTCVHHRRSLSDLEMTMLSPEWLAIPARDEFGPDGLIETRL
jgi:hypothetical protein